MTVLEEEDFGVLLLDPIAPLQDDEGVFVEDEDLTILEDDDLLSFWRLEEPTESMRLLEDFFVLLLDPFDFADVPLRVTLLLLWMAEDDDSSSITDVLLSSPQAVKKTKDERLKTRDKVARTCFITKLLFDFYTTDGKAKCFYIPLILIRCIIRCSHISKTSKSRIIIFIFYWIIPICNIP